MACCFSLIVRTKKCRHTPSLAKTIMRKNGNLARIGPMGIGSSRPTKENRARARPVDEEARAQGCAAVGRCAQMRTHRRAPQTSACVRVQQGELKRKTSLKRLVFCFALLILRKLKSFHYCLECSRKDHRLVAFFRFYMLFYCHF